MDTVFTLERLRSNTPITDRIAWSDILQAASARPVQIADARLGIRLVVCVPHTVITVADIWPMTGVTGMIASANPRHTVIAGKQIVTDAEPKLIPVRVWDTLVAVRCKWAIAEPAFWIAVACPVFTGITVPERIADTVAVLVLVRGCNAVDTLIRAWSGAAVAFWIA
jgi:hypothetical protein